MPAYSGKFQYLDERGAVLSQGACQFRFDAETAVVTPGSGTPIAFDLGDVDRVSPGEWDCELALFTGKRIQLRQFGAAFGRMSEELLATWRDRTVRCLLLEDLEEVGRYTGSVAAGKAAASPAEIRLYQSNLAVLPLNGLPMQWRLANVDSATFDDASYSLRLESAGESLTIGRLARKTDEFRGKLAEALQALHTHTAEALHTTFPLLDPDQLEELQRIMPEGRSARISALRRIHPKLPEALADRAVDAALQPYFDTLRHRCDSDALMAGFKFIRPGDGNGSEADSDEPDGVEASPAAPAEDTQPLFFWFFFPLSNRRVAWEATTGSGRATYFFRITAPAEAAIAELTRGLALVDFRREPIYLPDDSLAQQQRFHRYAIGCRKLPDLRALRAAFAGRAIHTTLEAWTAQLDAALA